MQLPRPLVWTMRKYNSETQFFLCCKVYCESKGDKDTEHFHHSPSEKQVADPPIRLFVGNERFELYVFLKGE